MLRKPVLMAFAKAAYAPLVTLHNGFMAFRKAKFYQIEMNYQTCYLESFLNDRFDPSQRRIYIEDAESRDGTFVFTRAEDQPLVIHKRIESVPRFIYTRGESNGDMLNDFIVFVPASVTFDEYELRAMISTKLSGKRYSVQLF